MHAQYISFDRGIHQRWGVATKEPKFREGAHGRLELVSNPKTQIQRSDKNNKWESVSQKQLKKEQEKEAQAAS